MVRKKICVITDKFLFGGLEKHIADFATKAYEKGYDVIIITGKYLNNVSLPPNVKVHEVDMNENKGYSEVLSTVYNIANILKKEGCNVVIIYPFLSLIYGAIACILSNIPYIVVLHGPLSITYSIPPNIVYKKFLEFVFKNAFKIYGVSQDIIDLTKGSFDNIDENKFTLFPNAILKNKKVYNIKHDLNGDILLVMSFQPIKAKGIKVFFDYYVKLPEKYKRKVHVFGDGESYDEIKKYINKKNLKNYVKFYRFDENFVEKLQNKSIFFSVSMARSAITLLSLNLPVLILGLDGPKGFVSKKNFEKFFYSNFSGINLPNLTLNDFISSLEDLIKNIDNYKLQDIVLEYMDYDKYFSIFEQDLNSLKKKSNSIYNDLEKNEEVYKILLSFLNAKNIFDSNIVYNLAFFSGKEEFMYILMNEFFKILQENEYYRIQIQNKDNELKILKEKCNNYEQAIKNLKQKNIYYEKKLNEIYTSRFWKIASTYYSIRDKVFSLPDKVLSLITLRKLKKVLNDAKESNKMSFIYPPTVDWNIPLFQRPQHISLELSKKENLVFYFTPNHKDRILTYKFISKDLIIARFFKDFIKSFDKFEKTWMFLPSTNKDISIGDLRKLKSKGLKIIYDYIDEIHPDISSETHISYKTFVELKDEDVDLITCVSKKLFNEMINRFPKEKVLYLPNGVDYNHFKVTRDLEKINNFMKSIVLQGKPIIGYYGALAKWIDYELLICAAYKNPDWSFVLIGVDYEGSLKNYLEKFPKNIYFLGHIPYKDLPWYAIWFDVALIPFKKGDIAKATSPIKMYEYMALNKPIVATEDLLECYGYEGVLISKNDCSDFIKKIQEALKLKDNPYIVKKLDEVARQNTWEKRAEEIIKYVKRYEET